MRADLLLEPEGVGPVQGGPGDDRALLDVFTEHDIRPILLHTAYLVNIAAPDPDIYAKSVASLVHAADRARRLDGWVVVHAGRDRTGPRPQAVERAAAAVLTAVKMAPGARILIEPTAGTPPQRLTRSVRQQPRSALAPR